MSYPGISYDLLFYNPINSVHFVNSNTKLREISEILHKTNFNLTLRCYIILD